MTTLEKFQEVANINFIQEPLHADIEIGELNTADGYELFYITKTFKIFNLTMKYSITDQILIQL